MVLGKMDIHMQINEIGRLSYIIHKNHLQVYKYINIRLQTVKPIEEKIREKLYDIILGNDLLHMTPKCYGKQYEAPQKIKSKNMFQQSHF